MTGEQTVVMGIVVTRYDGRSITRTVVTVPCSL